MIVISDINMEGMETSSLLDSVKKAAMADTQKTLIIAGYITCKASEKEYREVLGWLGGLLEKV